MLQVPREIHVDCSMDKALPYEVTETLSKIRRGGYIFISWKGDHAPRHVHVFRDGRLLVKWDLENELPMKGAAPRKLRNLIQKLAAEGLI